MRHRYAPPLTPGWGPISPSTRPSGRAGVIIQSAVPAGLAIFAVLRGLAHLSEGLAAAALAAAPFLLLLGLWFVLKASPNKGRTLIEWAAVVMAVILLSNGGLAVPNVKTVADRKAPVERVEQAQGDLDKARQGVINLWAQIASRFPGPTNKPEPKKGHH